jgi:hypothetical protein
MLFVDGVWNTVDERNRTSNLRIGCAAVHNHCATAATENIVSMNIRGMHDAVFPRKTKEIFIFK